jgi:hypothetical protein
VITTAYPIWDSPLDRRFRPSLGVLVIDQVEVRDRVHPDGHVIAGNHSLRRDVDRHGLQVARTIRSTIGMIRNTPRPSPHQGCAHLRTSAFQVALRISRPTHHQRRSRPPEEPAPEGGTPGGQALTSPGRAAYG